MLVSVFVKIRQDALGLLLNGNFVWLPGASLNSGGNALSRNSGRNCHHFSEFRMFWEKQVVAAMAGNREMDVFLPALQVSQGYSELLPHTVGHFQGAGGTVAVATLRRGSTLSRRQWVFYRKSVMLRPNH